MRVLVACEESQVVTIELRKLGHEAYSCDIEDCSGGHPEWHIKQDVLPLINGDCSFTTMDGTLHGINGKWDMLLAFPPCTYITNAGARWLYAGGKLNEERYRKGLAGKEFFMRFYNADCGKIAIENPVPSKVFEMPTPTQIIQPYEFGEPWSKKTLLWLKGLPRLTPTNIRSDYLPYCSSGSYSKNHDIKFRGASRKGGSAKSRSRTFIGIGKAMAEQWAGKAEGT